MNSGPLCKGFKISDPDHTTPLCSISHHFTQHYTTLHLTTPHQTTLHLTKPHQTTPHYTSPHHTKPHQTAPHHTKPHYTSPNHTKPHHTTLHLTTPHQPHYTSPNHTTPHQTTPNHTTLHNTSPINSSLHLTSSHCSTPCLTTPLYTSPPNSLRSFDSKSLPELFHLMRLQFTSVEWEYIKYPQEEFEQLCRFYRLWVSQCRHAHTAFSTSCLLRWCCMLPLCDTNSSQTCDLMHSRHFLYVAYM